MTSFGRILAYSSAHHVLGTETLAGLNWSVLVVNAPLFDKTTMKLAFILILLGYGTKAGIAPMHTWKPDAYSEAPVPVAAMLAAAVLNCALYGLIRIYVSTTRCLGPEFASQLLIIFGLLSVGCAGGHRPPAIQLVPKRVHACARGLRRAASLAADPAGRSPRGDLHWISSSHRRSRSGRRSGRAARRLVPVEEVLVDRPCVGR